MPDTIEGLTNRIFMEECVDGMKRIPDASVDLVCTDPPYFRVKDEDWDNVWKRKDDFLAWMGLVLDELRRVIKPAGSLYLFASPQMAFDVEAETRKRFRVLNRITWQKPPFSSKAEMCRKEDLRRFFPSETIIFGEQFNDGLGRIPAYKAGSPFAERIRSARSAAGVSRSAVDLATGHASGSDPSRGSGICYRWEEGDCVPTAGDWESMAAFFLERGVRLDGCHGDVSLLHTAFSEESLFERGAAAEYRRFFSASADRPYTDVWTYPTVTRRGKHVCEKPLDMIEHMILTSSRSGGIVLDPFMGSGTAAEACVRTGRRFVGFEKDPSHHATSLARVAAATLKKGTEYVSE